MFSLTPREQTKRVYNLSYALIGSCVDRNLLKEGPVPNRILHNKELAIQVITTIDRVKQQIQEMFHLNLLTLSKEMTNIVDNEVEKEKEKEFDFLASAYTLLGNTTQSGYNKIKKELVEQFQLPPEKLPSYYLLSQRRPIIVPFTIENDELFDVNFNALEDVFSF